MGAGEVTDVGRNEVESLCSVGWLMAPAGREWLRGR